MLASTAVDFTPGDLVVSSWFPNDVGMIVSMRETNNDSRFHYPYIYYVFYADKQRVRVMFRRELQKA